MEELSPDGKFRIDSYRIDVKSKPLHIFTKYITQYLFSVSSIETGDELMLFSGSSHSWFAGKTESGVSAVFFSKTEDAVVVKRFRGGDEKIELPNHVDIIERGRKIRLTWLGGRNEERDRRRVEFSAANGKNFSRMLYGAPETYRTLDEARKRVPDDEILRDMAIGREMVRFIHALHRHNPDAAAELRRVLVERLAALPPGAVDSDALHNVFNPEFPAGSPAPPPPAPKAVASARRAPRLEVKALKDDRGILTVALHGILDYDTTEILEAELLKWLGSPPVHCVVDCAGLVYLKSQGVTVLIRYADEFQAKKVVMALCDLGEGPMEVIKRLGLDQFFLIYPDAKSAADALTRA